MRQGLYFGSVLVVAAAILAVGCGGGSSPSSFDPVAALKSGISDLSTVLSNKGASAGSTLTHAATQFQLSYAARPSGQAAVGYAAAQGALDASEMAQLFNTSLPLKTEIAARAASLMVLWKIDPKSTGFVPKISSPLEAISVTGTSAGRAPRQTTPPSAATVIAELKKVERDLVIMLAFLTTTNIQSLESNPLILTMGTGTDAKTVKVGTAEGYALRAGIEGVAGAIDGLLAYNLDYGTYNWQANFYSKYQALLFDGGTLHAVNYLPPSPFLALNSDGASRLRNLESSWVGTANDGTSAVNTLSGRTTTGWLFNLLPYNSVDLTNALADINVFRTAITGPVPNVHLQNANGDPATVTVDLTAWTGGHPPASLRAFFPDLQTGASSTEVVPISGSIVDPTYGRLIPGGVPSAVLYDRSIEADADASLVEAQALIFLGIP